MQKLTDMGISPTPKTLTSLSPKSSNHLEFLFVSQDYWLRDLDQSPLQLQHEVLRFATGRVVKAETPTRRLTAATRYIEVSLGDINNGG
jgi:hypothetical protein